ncbi:MAG TPA: alpha/beta hydrolase [Streptosporangiaceae bacterium]
MTFIPRRWKYAFGTAAAALAGIVATATLASASPVANHSAHAVKAAKPTIVLVHGGFADASSWNGVIPQLLKDGYPVVAPANPLRGVSGDAEYIRSVLDTIKGPIVLVGHSYGGAVITNAAAGDQEVKALVYTAAFAPDVGEQLGTLLQKFPGSEVQAALQQIPYTGPVSGESGTDLYLNSSQFRAVFAADLPASQTALMFAEQRPFSANCFTDVTTAAAWHTIPSWGIVAGADKAIPPALETWMYQRAHAHITVVPGASHVVMLSQPGIVDQVIEQAAAATS